MTSSSAAFLRLEKEREIQKKELFNLDPSYRINLFNGQPLLSNDSHAVKSNK